MKTIRELLQDADPLRNEPTWSSGERDIRRKAILAAASEVPARVGVRPRSRIAILAALGAAIVLLFLGPRIWSPLVTDLQGAVRFEVRLAEDKPAPGLREAKVAGSDRSVYLHPEVIVDNGDIAAARVVQGNDPSHYAIEIKFKATGADKIRAATQSNIGKIGAILFDGAVVMAPVIRSPISASALVTGSFTKDQAESFVSRMGIQ